MKTKSFFCCAILSIVIVSCVKEPQPIRVSSITLNSSSLELVEGESADLVATISPKDADNQTVIWSSTNGSVASVSNGKITALAPGSTTITAKSDDGGFTASCSVTVVAKIINVSSLSLSIAELTLTEGDSETIIATVKPDNATDKTVTWSTSDESIATVDGGKITAIKEGTATITAKAGDKTATCKVTVEKKVIAVETVELDKSKIELTEGESATLVATVKPDDATDKSVTWSSSDPEVATVEEGAVTALKEGTATITVKVGEKIAVESIELNKSEINLFEGESEILVATIKPDDATNKTVIWSSSDLDVATVDDGKVIAIREGIATIYARADNKVAECVATIKFDDRKNIRFADLNVKEKLIASFDKDGDGELSYNEAKAVNSSIELMNAFSGRNDYESFDEFQFFTNITDVVDKMFNHWSKMVSITLPESIVTIGTSAFGFCSSLKKIIIQEGILGIGDTAFEYCKSLECIPLPRSLQYFGKGAFWNCSSLRSIDIPEQQHTIGVMTFCGCSSLESVSFRGGIYAINMNAFSSCEALCDIELPSDICQIWDYAFSSCSSIKSIVIKNASLIGKGAFLDCTSLERISIVAVNPSPVGIGTGRVDSEAFKNCTNLVEASISTDVIGSQAFMGCISLKSVSLLGSDNLYNIGELSFANCSKLESITLPMSLKYIGQYAFKNCSSLSKAILKPTIPPGSDGKMFDGADLCTIFVPSNSVGAYKSAQYWSDYADRIQAISE